MQFRLVDVHNHLLREPGNYKVLHSQGFIRVNSTRHIMFAILEGNLVMLTPFFLKFTYRSQISSIFYFFLSSIVPSVTKVLLLDNSESPRSRIYIQDVIFCPTRFEWLNLAIRRQIFLYEYYKLVHMQLLYDVWCCFHIVFGFVIFNWLK